MTNYSPGSADAALRSGINAFLGSNSFANFPLDLLVGQLKFPSTQNPSTDVNTLDDYEEGSFTPALTFETPGDLSVAYAVQAGAYIKIGKLVYIGFNVETSSFTHATASGDLLITGLPFTAETITNIRFHGSLSFSGITKAGYTQFIPHARGGEVTMHVTASASGLGTSSVSAANVPSGGTVILTGSLVYRATA